MITGTRNAISATTATLGAAIVIALALLPAAASARDHTGTRHSKPSSGQQLGGTWLTAVTLQNPPPGINPTFLGLETYMPSGELVVSSSQANPTTRTLAQGGWIRTGNRRFDSSFSWFRFDSTGAFVGMQRVRRTITLAASLTTFTATDVVEILNPAGAVVATIQATETGRRLPASGA